MKNKKPKFYKKFKPYFKYMEPMFGGVHYVFIFDNKFGASVIKHSVSFGYKDDEWEIAVIKKNKHRSHGWELDFSTDVTDDVIGWQDEDEVTELMQKIKEL